MNTSRARALFLSLLVAGTFVTSALAASENASAAGVAGTWVSTTYGEGYVLDNVPTGPYTWHYDVVMELSQSGSAVSGTATFTLVSVDLSNPSYEPWSGGTGIPLTYSVTGFTGGDVFSIWVYTNYTATGDLAYTSDSMYGMTYHSMDEYNNFVGVWDLKKEGGLFAVGGINPVVSVIGIGIAVAAIAVAASPVRPSPKGARPGETRVPYAHQPSPSQQTTTGYSGQPYAPDHGTPVGGVGLHYPPPSAPDRPLTESERQVLKGITRSPKVNAVGLAIMAMAMAVMINFVEEPVALIMPLFFGAISLGTAFQARKVSSSVALSLQKGTATEVRGAPRYVRGVWDFGAFSVPSDGQLKGVLSEDAPTSLVLVPDARRVLSVNNVPLRKPVELRAAPGFESALVVQFQAPPWKASPAPDQDVPPPPDGWAPNRCAQCGRNNPDGAMFCDSCGKRLRA